MRQRSIRMYGKLKTNEDIILTPMLHQMEALDTALRQNNPKVLALNREIAELSEQRHKISALRTNGLLDADSCAVRLNTICARLTQLRGERRRLDENEELEDTMTALHKTVGFIRDGPEQLSDLDDEQFENLVEKIVAESQTCLHFRLYGGLELTEQIGRACR